MRRLVLPVFVFACLAGILSPVDASAQQSVNIFLGGFVPRSLDGRGTNDVIFQDGTFLTDVNSATGAGIDVTQFNGVTIGGEYLVGLAHFFEAGLGVGFYQKTVSTTYTDFVNSNGNEIPQDLKLRIVPFTATIRFLPLGSRGITPYIGAGVGVYNWRWSETGQFVDSNGNVFAGTFVGSGTSTGPVVLGGVRLPVGPVAFGGEIRWQGGSGDLPVSQNFAGSKIDLGGVNYLFIVNFKF